MGRGAWRDTGHRVAESWTLKQLSTHARGPVCIQREMDLKEEETS